MAMDMAMDLAMAIAKIKVFFHEGCQVQLQVWASLGKSTCPNHVSNHVSKLRFELTTLVIKKFNFSDFCC